MISLIRLWHTDVLGKGGSRLIPLAIVIITCCFYARTLDGYFNSDDFILLRLMDGVSSSQQVLDQLSSNWLSLRFLNVYRPLCSLFFCLVYQVFGVNPFWYHLIGLSFHVANAMLVIVIANSLTNHRNAHIGHAAGLLFALHPLHPNAVAWISAFPTVFCTFFVLLSLLTFLHFMESGGIGYGVLSIAAYALALGSYEGAVVYPALAAGCAWLKEDGRIAAGTIRRFAVVCMPYVAVGAAYFLVRKMLLGSSGPLTISEIIGHTIGRVTSLPHVLARTIYPLISPDQGERVLRWAVFITVAACATISFKRLITVRENIVMVVFVLFWVFSTVLVSGSVLEPAIGRYAYLASLGVCVGLSFLTVRALPLPRSGMKHLLSGGLLLLLVFCYARLLNQSLFVYERAARVTQSLQRQLIALDSGRERPHTYFMGHYPRHITEGGYNLAQLFVTGLADSVRPPFTDRKIRMYPFIDFFTLDELPLLATGRDVVLLTWNQALEQVQVVASTYPKTGGTPHVPHLEILYPPDDTVLKGFGSHPVFAFEGGTYEKFRLVFITSFGMPLQLEVTRNETVTLKDTPQGLHREKIPEDLRRMSAGERALLYVLPGRAPQLFLDIDTLYGDEFYWWIEALDHEGQTITRSTMKTFRIAQQDNKGK